MNSRVQKTLAHLLPSAALSLSAALLLSGATGCTSLHRKPVATASVPTEAPELSQTPLYSPEMGDNTTRLPNIPVASQTAVVQPPPPAPPKPHHTKKPKTTVAGKNPASTTDSGSNTAAATPPAATPPKAAVETTSMSAPPAEKKTISQQASSAIDTPAASPIGELTAGSAADAAQTSHETADLIRNTRDGLNGIKRPLSSDEKKTAGELVNFLDRAQQALQNGDVDGAHGLATKAKLLLDELTQK